MRKSLVLVTTLLIVLLYSCHRKPANDTSTKATEVSFSQPFYKHLKGTINNNAAEMELNYGGNNSFTGVYYYTSSLVPINFYGEVDSGNVISFTVFNYESNNEEVFSCKFIDGVLQGAYSDSLNNQFPVKLQEDYSMGNIPFTAFALADSFKVDTIKLPEVVSEFTWQYLMAGDTLKVLNKELLKAVAGTDSLDAVTAFKMNAESYFNEYAESNKDLLNDTLYDWTLNWYSYSSMDIMYNRNGLLSYGVANASYTGGAHGYEYTQCYTYDVQHENLITYSQLFNAADSLKLENILNTKAREMFGITATTPLSERLLTESVKPIDNFYLTETGIVFNYPPYQIASYAQGEIKIYVPFAELQGIIKPQPFMGIAF